MSWPAASPGRPGVGASSRLAEFAQSLKQHVRDGLSPELALDLALNELVVAATTLIHADAAAVALARGDQMVCRATTGDHAPDLGIPIHARTGLSGACIRSRSPQNCRDTESDELVDPDVSRLLGIRSILVVPILDGQDPVGIIEAFSRRPSAFSPADEFLLQQLALDCLKLQQLSVELTQRPYHKLEDPELSASSAVLQSATTVPDDRAVEAAPSVPKVEQDSYAAWETLETLTPPSGKRKSRIDKWTMVLTVLVTVAAVTLIFLVAFRLGWLRASPTHPAGRAAPQTPAPEQNQNTFAAKIAPPEVKSGKELVITSQPAGPAPAAGGELVIYERGKLIFRSQATTARSGPHSPPSAVTSAHKVARVWLAPAAAEARLRDRVEPEYPAEARAANHSGDVTLQILVRENGSVASVRAVKGDPLLAAAATAAVRNWHYEPYQVNGRAKEFQTDVMLKFSLSQ